MSQPIRGRLVFQIDPKNINLVEDVKILLPVKFRWIPFSGFTEFGNISANPRQGRPSCFKERPKKHELCRGRWDLASCQVSLNSVQQYQRRSRKLEKLMTTDDSWMPDDRQHMIGSGALKKYGQVVKVLDSCFGDCGFKPQWSQLFCWFDFFFNSRTPVTPEITLKSPLFVESVEASIVGWVPFSWSLHPWLNPLLLKTNVVVSLYVHYYCRVQTVSNPHVICQYQMFWTQYYISSTHN